MTASLPAGLKSADIARFTLRAGQLENIEPVIAYWCNYWVINQILSKNLHNTNDECMTYTMHIMDKLEKVKAEQGENDAIIDDMAGKAYVEQFGLKTLQRAENAMNQNRVSRQTADTLLAAATFLELCQIWGTLEPDLASKIKFAKYHAVRIARAIKAGEDPNLSNPTVESSAIQEQPYVPSGNAESPGVQSIKDIEDSNRASRQPFVEEVPDEHDTSEPGFAQRSMTNQSSHPYRSHPNSAPPNQSVITGYDATPSETADYYTHLAPGQKSPLAPWTNHSQSDGGEYFPEDVQPENSDSISLPEIPSGNPSYSAPPKELLSSADTAPQTTSRIYPHSSDRPEPRSLESFPPPDLDQPTPPEPFRAPVPSYAPPHLKASRNSPVLPTQPPSQGAHSKTQDQAASGFHSVRHTPVSSQSTYVADEDAIMTSQKHARWAISALNFEDVNTAVKELKFALEALGAR